MFKRDYVIHTREEICEIRKVASLAALIRDQLRQMVISGMSTAEIDELAARLIASAGAASAFLGYKNFPGNICISLNDEVVHGVSSYDKKVLSGDLLSIDIGVKLNGCIGDTAVSFIVDSPPNFPEETSKLLIATHEALMNGISAAKAGNRVRHISAAIENTAKIARLGVVREYVGHGVGLQLHEPPEIPNFVSSSPGPTLRNGMVLAIEPMFNLGSHKVKTDNDRWTVRTSDGRLSAHFEHMVLINDDKPEILTWPKMM